MKNEARPYVFYRYNIYKYNNAVSGYEHYDLFKSLRAIEVPHRKSEAIDDDKDTSLINLKKTSFPQKNEEGTENAFQVIYFKVARHITVREKNGYDKNSDVLTTVAEAADEYGYGELVIIPERGLIAASDRSGLNLIDARSTISRLRSIVVSKKHYTFTATPIVSATGLKNALENWTIDSVSFSAKPFNPSVKKPGDILHRLLEPDNVQIRGNAKPWHGDKVKLSEGGFLNELVGLFDSGYAEIGLSGETQHGYKASIKKNKIGQSAKEQQIKVFIPEHGELKKHIIAVVTAMLDIDGKKE